MWKGIILVPVIISFLAEKPRETALLRTSVQTVTPSPPVRTNTAIPKRVWNNFTTADNVRKGHKRTPR